MYSKWWLFQLRYICIQYGKRVINLKKRGKDYDTTFYNWSPLKNLGPNINGPQTWEAQPSLSGDGKTLYFASARPGGLER